MSNRTTRRIEVRLDRDQAERLARVLETKGLSVTEFVRQAIADAAKKDEQETVRSLLQSFRDSPLKAPPLDELKQILEEVACPGEPLCPGHES